jgi:hypothetical protein
VKWTGHETCNGEARKAYIILAGKPEGKKLLVMPRRRCDLNINMYLKVTGYGGVDCTADSVYGPVWFQERRGIS